MNTNIITSSLMSEENANALENKMFSIIENFALQGRQATIDIALLTTEAIEKKLHVIKGYEDNTIGAKAYLSKTFGIKDTQRKVYAIVTHKFAKQNADGSYTIDNRLRDFGVANLEQLQKLELIACDTQDTDNFLIACEQLGISDKTTVSELKKLRGIEDKNSKKKADTSSADTSSDDTTSADTSSDDTSSADTSASKNDIVLYFIKELEKAKDLNTVKLLVKDFKKQYKSK